MKRLSDAACRLEGQKMFQQLMSSIGSQVANIIFKVSLMKAPQQVKAQERRPDIVKEKHKHNEVINEPAHRPATAQPRVGRNDPCPCGAINPDGSPKKYKKCHGA